MQNLNESLQAKYPHLELAILPLSQVKKGNEAFRIDSEPFKKSNLSLNSNIEYIKLSQIVTINPSKTEIQKYDENLEVTFLSMQNLGNGFVNERDKGAIKYFKGGYTYFAENDILIAKITPCMEHGKCAIATNLTNKIGFGSTEFNVFRVKDSRFLQEFIFCYLNRDNIRKIAADNMIGTSGRQRVPTAFYENLPIPLFPKPFQLEIEKLVKQSHEALEDSKRLYKEAQELLYKELELDFKNPLESLLKSSLQAKKASETTNINDISKKYPHLNISVRPLSKSLHKSGRLDSEYYQSKYDTIERKIKDYQGGWGYVKTMFSHNNLTCNFLKDKYKYIEIGDINTSNGMASFNEIRTNELPANAKIILAKNDILISKVRPYRGAVAIIDFDIKDIIASSAFVVLRENGDFKKEVLQVLLRTTIYKEWLLKWNVGTSYPVIKDENILDLPIPKITPTVQEQIALKIQKSFTLRAKSKDLLQNAKIKLENAIEMAN